MSGDIVLEQTRSWPPLSGSTANYNEHDIWKLKSVDTSCVLFGQLSLKLLVCVCMTIASPLHTPAIVVFGIPDCSSRRSKL